jgi:hypothetical protein
MRLLRRSGHSRRVEVAELDASRREIIDDLKFENNANLVVTDAGLEVIKGIVSPSERYVVGVDRAADRLVFSFGDDAGQNGTLTLRLPPTIFMFEIDPRDGQHSAGGGVSLYKEWKLTSNMEGTGIFRAGNGKGEIITLILQGRGNWCSAFTHWTLVIDGPTANYSLFGALLARE